MTESAELKVGTGPELVFGLVGTIGCDMENFSNILAKELQVVGYESSLIRVSELFSDTSIWAPIESEYLDIQITHLQDMGDKLREKSQQNDFSALLAVKAIRSERAIRNVEPVPRHAYLIRQIKTPEEVDTLRSIYGQNFFLLGLYSKEDHRIRFLAESIAKSRSDTRNYNKYEGTAKDLIHRDDHELHEYGQNTRVAYPKADIFFLDKEYLLNAQITRFIQILFGHPTKTPTLGEYLMHQAGAAALRSSHHSRQVGAAIAKHDGSIIAVGTNEAPKIGGGSGWEGESPSTRLCDLEDDSHYKNDAFIEIFDILKEGLEDKISLTKFELRDQALPLMKDTQFMGTQEFERSVHAEMAALLDAARRGVSVEGTVLYTTTFPCQNCAKHIIAAGIGIVVFMEPYPKGYTRQLYRKYFVEDEAPIDSSTMKKHLKDFSQGDYDRSIILGAYLGVAPRRYREFFEMPKRKDRFGESIDWNKDKLISMPRLAMTNEHLAYIPRETIAIEDISTLLNQPL